MKTVAIIQARMESRRFPGKVMERINGLPMFWHVVLAAQKIERVDQVVVAIPATDEIIAKFCYSKGFDYIFFGASEDVLDRFWRAARFFEANHIVRLTGDCPMLNPVLATGIVRTYLRDNRDEQKYHYLSNRWPVPFVPSGQDVEIFSFEALNEAYHRTTERREHVTEWIRANMRCGNPERLYKHSVDTPEELGRVRAMMVNP